MLLIYFGLLIWSSSPVPTDLENSVWFFLTNLCVCVWERGKATIVYVNDLIWRQFSQIFKSILWIKLWLALTFWIACYTLVLIKTRLEVNIKSHYALLSCLAHFFTDHSLKSNLLSWDIVCNELKLKTTKK